MARVTYSEVNALGQFKATQSEMEPYIELAHEFLPEDAIQTEKRKKQLEKLLAAHFFSIIEPGIVSEGAGPSRIQYANAAMGSGLNASRWGQEYQRLLNTEIGIGLPIVL